MNFNTYSKLKGTHSVLSPSQPQWLRYSEDQLYERYCSRYATAIGTSLHELAETLIKNNLKLKKTDKLTVVSHLLSSGIPRFVFDIDNIYLNFMTYVNDAIGFKLTPEQILYHSDRCYGTADAISFRKNFLRIHDYKSGTIPAKMEQLEIYAALFCLEYEQKPGEIEMELRIYQNNEIVVHNPTAEDILPIMDTIVTLDKSLERMCNEEV